MSTAPREVAIEPGLIERLAAGARYLFTGNSSLYDGWFGPGTPPVPVADPSTKGREFDYATNVNTRFQPRQGEAITFGTLRSVADGYDLMRLAIETKKDELVQTAWTVRPIDQKAKPDDRCRKIKDFLRYPDREHTWDQWFRASCEDLLAVDAWTVYPRRTKGGDPYSLDLIDGTTIKPVIALDGRKPETGAVYQQVLKGVIVADFAPGELYYMPQNVRTHHAYGYSRVEQVLVTADIALNRQLSKLACYTAGVTSDSVFEGPEDWTMEQLKTFRIWLNHMLSGNITERKKALVVPHGTKITNMKEAVLKDEYDDFLARFVCYAFSVSPSQLIKEQNHGKDQTQQEAAKAQGTRPILNFFSKQLTRMICRDLFKADDLEIVPAEEVEVDPLKQAQIDDLDVKNHIRTPNECREGRGLEALEGGDEFAAPPAPFGAPPDNIPPKGDGTKPQNQDTTPPSTVAPPASKEKPPAAGSTKKAHHHHGLTKSGHISRRDRPEMLKQEAKVSLGVSKRLHALAKDVVPRIVEAYGALAKDDKDPDKRAAKLAVLVKAEDLRDVSDYLQDRSLESYESGVKLAASLIDADEAMVHLANEKAVDWAIGHAGERIKDFETATQNDIESITSKALSEGWSNDKLAGQLEDSWSFSAQRAEVIARTETAFADVQGNVALYKEAGVQELVVIGGEDPCDECADEIGKDTISVDDDLPPYHPRCECDVVPVIPETQE
jgi:SPP1 gp7 family putative phage head morphogenesis protein